MLEFTQKLHDELLRELENLERKLELDPFAPDRRPATIYSAIEKLKAKLKSHVFDKEEDEIHFFKKQLPLFHSLLIYYTEKARLGYAELLQRPAAAERDQGTAVFEDQGFLSGECGIPDLLPFGQNKYLDSIYFLRSNFFLQENTDFLTAVMDLSCCTIHSFKIAVDPRLYPDHGGRTLHAEFRTGD